MSPAIVSVIIPFYNAQATLAETLKSVEEQTMADWEGLLINDGSTDRSPELANEFIRRDSRFRLITTKNQGLSSARNTGLIEAKGKYIQFLDADDLIEMKKFESQVALASKRPIFWITYSNCTYFLDHNTSLSKAYKWKPFKSSEAKTLFAEKNQVPVSSPLINAEFARKVGYFDIKLQCLEDWDYWIRCNFNHAKWEFLAETNCDTRIRQRLHSMSSDQEKMIISEISVFRKYNQSKVFKKEFLKKKAFHRKALLASFIKGQLGACKKHLLFLCYSRM